MPLVWMSFSAMPADLIAAITFCICAALADSAALASAACVTTPVDSEATSGTRLASARAETESRVPSLAGAVAGGWALAVMVIGLRAGAQASAVGDCGLRCIVVFERGFDAWSIALMDLAVSRHGVGTGPVTVFCGLQGIFPRCCTLNRNPP